MRLHWGYILLTLMSLLLSLSTGELNFYRDALPETSEDIALEHLARYLGAQRFQQRLHRSHLSSLLSPGHKQHTLELDRQKERDFLEILADKAALKNLLKQHNLKIWPYHRQNQNKDPIDRVIPNREYFLPYYDLGLRLAYAEEKPNEDERRYKNLDNQRIPGSFDMDRDTIEEPMVNFRGRYLDHNRVGVLHEDGKDKQSVVTEPEFTYKFDNSNFQEKHPFAVKPNDPRYYDDASFLSSDPNYENVAEHNSKKEKMADKEQVLVKHEDEIWNIKPKISKDLAAANSLGLEEIAEHHPLIVPINHDLNSDIYFIAIVAGCSAAAMFALVLISLTWCRLQRGVKAAADIEYPAYGVTGPNKDVSPSGDQRLAQSAQMYHFQHQKQQIIAMENRTSATRDPGSLSEAESDEENEEGDYTVYECPGLASTGEMEVKNPMFHDDPTPATPAQSNKDEDQI